MAVTIKTKAQIAANRAANNARISAANAKAGKTAAQQATADASALASVNKVRKSQGLPEQAAIGEQAPSRTPVLSINQQTNEVIDSSGNVLYQGSSLSDALAKQTQLSSGSAPTVAGRPDLFAVAPGANQEVKPYYDATIGKTVTPTTATPEQMAAQAAGTLESYNKAQGLSYLDGTTFKELQPYLNESDLVRGPNGQIWLRSGLTVDQIRQRASTSVNGTTTGVTGATTLGGDVTVSDSELTTDNLSSIYDNPVSDNEFSALLKEITAQQEDLLSLLRPSDEETALKAQINDIKAQIEKTLTELSMGLNNVEDQPIAMQFITGQQASIQRSAEAKLQNLARIESNLLYNLGLEQEARQVEATVAQTKLGYLQTNLDTAFKVQALIQQQEDSIFNRTMALKTSAQNTLSIVLDSLQGVDESDMTSEQISQLQQLASNAGIPYSILSEGLTNVKNSLLASASSLDKLPTSYQEWMLAGGEAGTGMTYGDYLSGNFSGSTYSSDQLTALNTIVDNMNADADVKNFVTIRDGYNRVNSGSELNTGAGDLQVVFGYMKMLDPTSVVREGEFATAENSAGVPETIRALYNKVVGNGRLSEQQRQEFVDGAQSLYNSAKSNYDSAYSYYVNLAQKSGLNPSDVIRDYSSSSTTSSGSTSSSFLKINQSFNSLNALISSYPDAASAISALKNSGWQDDEILRAVELNGGLGFSAVGADTNSGSKTSAIVLNKLYAIDNGDHGGQCGHFVNVNAGTRMGDSYESKMAYVNVSNKSLPVAGDVFVMPYKQWGHTGFVLSATRKADGTYDVLVKDSNWHMNETVDTHIINSSKISGYYRA